jgi:VWFA-related protein
MSLFKRTALWLSIALTLAGAVYAFQAQPPDQGAVIHIDVDLVQLDAVVTNSKDEPVIDLKAEDFTVLQDGKPQEITHFSFIRTKDPTPRPPARKAPDSKETVTLVAPPPPVPVKRDKVRRTIAIVVDDLGLSMETTVRVRASIRKWLDNDMQPDDLVAIMRTGGAVGSLQQFSNDKRMLYATADRLSYNAASRVGVSSFDPISGTQQKDRLTGLQKERKDAYGFELPMPGEERDLQFTQFSLASIQYIVNGLKDLPGRKSVILFSEHLEMMFDNNRGQNQGREVPVRERMRTLTDAANRAGVVIHSIDPRGVAYTGFTAEDNPWGDEDSFSKLDPIKTTQVFNQRDRQLNSSRDGMAILAKQTGGLFLYNRNDIGRALEVAANDGDGYYLLGYQPDSKTISEMKKGNPKFHSIQVRVNRPGLHVRSRSEFFSSPDSKAAPELDTRPRQVEKTLLSPFKSEDIRVRLTPLFSQTKEGKSVINALVHFDTDQLLFSEEPEGWLKASVELVASIYNADGRLLELQEKTWNVMAKGQTYEKMKKSGISFLINVPAKDPGAYQMRLVVRDTKNGHMGSATQFVEIPNIRDGKLTLSGILLAADKSKSRAAVDQTEGMIESTDHQKTAAVRIFDPGETIAWAYQVLNAKVGSDHKPQLLVQLRIFRDGQEFFTGKPSPMAAEEQGSSKRMVATDQVHFNQLPPGYYVLQVAVMDTLANEKQRIAAQAIDFDVQAK